MTAPLTSPEMDMRSLDGFLLNVERLLASELWALTKTCPEAFRGATGLWCRAWKQIPACSLPPDEAVLAAFADLAPAKFRKHRDLIMRGFELCDDGRYYHRTLSEEANRVWPSILKTRREREADKERLRAWRDRKRNGSPSGDETVSETVDETPMKRCTSEIEGTLNGSNTEGKDTSSLRSDDSARGATLFDPDGLVSKETWSEFVKMRKKNKAPLTDHAADLILKELRKLRAQGHDPTAVLEQSTRNSWRDVFPIREQRNGTNGSGYHERNHSSVLEGTRRSIEREQARPAEGDDARRSHRGLQESGLDAAGA